MAEEHHANVPNARTCDERVMDAQGQHLPPQALAGRRDSRYLPSAAEIQEAAKRDQRRLKIHDSSQVVHQGYRPFQQRTARYVEANGSSARAKQDMLAVLAADDCRLGSAPDKIKWLRLPVHNGQCDYLEDGGIHRGAPKCRGLHPPQAGIGHGETVPARNAVGGRGLKERHVAKTNS